MRVQTQTPPSAFGNMRSLQIQFDGKGNNLLDIASVIHDVSDVGETRGNLFIHRPHDLMVHTLEHKAVGKG